MMHVRRFANRPESVPLARRFALQFVDDVPREVCQEVLLIVSELATNCIRHTMSAFEVRVERGPNSIRIECEDVEPSRPFMRWPTVEETTGRGLQIVSSLADDWGVTPAAAGSGKTVWARIRVPAERLRSDSATR
jgi:serine/threonine-protein kinase RsbW